MFQGIVVIYIGLCACSFLQFWFLICNVLIPNYIPLVSKTMSAAILNIAVAYQILVIFFTCLKKNPSFVHVVLK